MYQGLKNQNFHVAQLYILFLLCIDLKYNGFWDKLTFTLSKYPFFFFFFFFKIPLLLLLLLPLSLSLSLSLSLASLSHGDHNHGEVSPLFSPSQLNPLPKTSSLTFAACAVANIAAPSSSPPLSSLLTLTFTATPSYSILTLILILTFFLFPSSSASPPTCRLPVPSFPPPPPIPSNPSSPSPVSPSATTNLERTLRPRSVPLSPPLCHHRPRAHAPTPSSPSPASPSPMTDLDRILNKFDSNDDNNISSSELAVIFSSLDHPLSSSKLFRMMVGAVISFVELPPPLLDVANFIANLCIEQTHLLKTAYRLPLLSPSPFL